MARLFLVFSWVLKLKTNMLVVVAEHIFNRESDATSGVYAGKCYA